ncbi:MAG: GTPase Era [Terriglobia bacterium]
MSFRSGFVSLLGKTNTGKSTLLNALLGAKVAIVSPRPQTTRTRVQGVLTRESAQVVFVDTPGVHQPASRLGRQMMQAVGEALEGVDLVLLLVDASQPPGAEDHLAIRRLQSFGGTSFLLLNKMDKIAKPELLPSIDHYRQQHAFQEFIPISALRGENLELLERKIIEYLPEGPPYFPPDTLTDQPERFLAAEIIREKILAATRREVPYAVAVVVDQFEECRRAAPPEAQSPAGDRSLVRIHVTILVERPGQKAILIGVQGQRMKSIGRAARKELEALLGCKVYLELYVKTRADWRQQPGVERLIDWRFETAE